MTIINKANSALAQIHMQIMWSRLIAVVEEQAQTLVRTAFSTSAREAGDIDPVASAEDLALQSSNEVIGYHIHAADGDIGHVENLLIDSATWGIRYLIVATSNWWIGQHVLISPAAVRDIDWSERHVKLNVTRDQVQTSPPWDPIKLMDQDTMKQLHNHYGWPGSNA